MEANGLTKTTFRVEKMDCAAEEQLVRLQLADEPNVKRLVFDLERRTLVVTHAGERAPIEHLIDELNLDAQVVGQEQTGELAGDLQFVDDSAQQSRLLWIVLLINFGLFAVEIVAGFLAQSMGLVADSLDMLADAIVYALSLYAVGKAAAQKRNVARLSGYFQLGLAILGIAEVIRRFVGAGEEPDFALMIGISLLALAGNVASLYVLRRTRSREAHIQASQIFTSNDVIVNLGVILAGVLVYFTASSVPDLVIGAIVFVLVASGAFRILKLAR